MATTTMDAVRYHGPNEVRLESVPVPAVQPGAVLVEVKAAALCHTELHFADGTLNLGVKPITLGHEAAGVIVKVGEGVDPSRVGQRVLVYYYVGCGVCRWCKTAAGDEQLCDSLKAEFGFISDGGLAGYLVAPSRNALLLPETISFEQAAPIGCGVTTAVHAAKRAQLVKGDTVVVYGCNGVGHGLVQLAKSRGCRVIAVARQQVHRDRAIALGADAAVDGTDAATVAQAVKDANGGNGADVVFECVGRRETLDACVGWAGVLGKRGRLVLVGYTQGEEHEFRCHPIPLVVFEQSIIGSVGATLQDTQEAIDLVASGVVSTVVDSCISLQDFQSKGLDRIKKSECVGKIVVNKFS